MAASVSGWGSGRRAPSSTVRRGIEPLDLVQVAEIEGPDIPDVRADSTRFARMARQQSMLSSKLGTAIGTLTPADMMMERLLWCCVVSSVLAAAACSPPNRHFPGASFPVMGSMTCTVKPVHDGVLNPTYFRGNLKDSLELTFRNLNLQAGTATLVGNNGSAQVEYRTVSGQMQFIETTTGGNLTMTTVFAPPERGKPMPSVHSRHIGIAPANIVISQFAGPCIPS